LTPYIDGTLRRYGRTPTLLPVEAGERDSGLRLAELVAAFSLATDLGLGQPMEHVLRSWVIAARADVYGDETRLWALLRFAEEEVKHQEMLRRATEQFRVGSGSPAGWSPGAKRWPGWCSTPRR